MAQVEPCTPRLLHQLHVLRGLRALQATCPGPRCTPCRRARLSWQPLRVAPAWSQQPSVPQSSDLGSMDPARASSVSAFPLASSRSCRAQIVGSVGFQGKQLERPQHKCTFLVELCMRCMAHRAEERPAFPVRP